MTQFELSSCVLPNSWYQWCRFITGSVNADQLEANISKRESAFCVASQELELKQSSERKGTPPGMCGKANYSVPLQLNFEKESVEKDQFQDSPRECSAGQQMCSEFIAKRAHQGFEDKNRSWPGSIQPLTRHGR